MIELDVFIDIYQYFVDNDIVWYTEIPVSIWGNYHTIDVVAEVNNKINCFEIKKSLTKKVIAQAKNNLLYTNYSWIVVPTNPRNQNLRLCKELGIGVISTKGGAKVVQKIDIKYMQRVRKFPIPLYAGRKFGVPGMPSPRADVIYKIKAMTASGKKYTWRELFNKIPNHYASVTVFKKAVLDLAPELKSIGP